jgi:hypothetical protein
MDDETPTPEVAVPAVPPGRCPSCSGPIDRDGYLCPSCGYIVSGEDRAWMREGIARGERRLLGR